MTFAVSAVPIAHFAAPIFSGWQGWDKQMDYSEQTIEDAKSKEKRLETVSREQRSRAVEAPRVACGEGFMRRCGAAWRCVSTVSSRFGRFEKRQFGAASRPLHGAALLGVSLHALHGAASRPY